jgi:hypothetical protein
LIGIGLANAGPPGVGFDLGLLLEAGDKAAHGLPLYSPSLVSGATVEAQSLFYSYPPFVAQVMALIAWLPLEPALVAWCAASTLAFAGVGILVIRRFAPDIAPSAVAVPLLTVTPLVVPYAVGMLFGNFNVFFPALYGLILLAAVATPGDRPSRIVGGVALGLAAATKVHPASLGLWFLVRGLRQRRGGEPAVAWETLSVAIVTGALLVGASVGIGGLQPWADYVAVVRASSGAELLDHRNYGPAAELGLAVGLNETAVRILHAAVALAAVATTAWAAWSGRRVLGSVAIAATASLVILPVTWIHYPAALMPFVVAALAQDRRGGQVGLIALALGCAAASMLIGPFLWVAVGLTLLVVAKGGPEMSGAGAVSRA